MEDILKVRAMMSSGSSVLDIRNEYSKIDSSRLSPDEVIEYITTGVEVYSLESNSEKFLYKVLSLIQDESDRRNISVIDYLKMYGVTTELYSDAMKEFRKLGLHI